MMLDNRAIVSVLLKDSLIVFYRTRRGPTLPASNEKCFSSFVCPNHSPSALGLSGE